MFALLLGAGAVYLLLGDLLGQTARALLLNVALHGYSRATKTEQFA